MEPIKIAVHVPLAAAVAAGRASYGDTEVALSEVDLASLSADGRAALARGSTTGGGGVRVENGRLLVTEASSGAVLVAIEAVAVDQKARAAEQARFARMAAEEDEASVLAALAKPDTDWIVRSDADGSSLTTRAPWTRRPSNPRLAERAKLVAERSLPAAIEAHRERVAAGERAKTEREEKDAAARVAYTAALALVASREDDLARPAAEGYSVERAVLDRLASRLMEAVATGDARVDTTYYRDPEDRAAPSPAAFALYDKVKSAIKLANALLPEAIGQWELSRIVRVDVCPHRGKSHLVTAVLATLHTKCGAEVREIIWSTESLECDHEEE